MDTISAFIRGTANRGQRIRVFDWAKALQILNEKKPDSAGAGLSSDLEWTGGTIWLEGKPYYDGYTFLASNWAIPVLIIDGEEIECWVYKDESPGWDAKSKWPNLEEHNGTQS